MTKVRDRLFVGEDADINSVALNQFGITALVCVADSATHREEIRKSFRCVSVGLRDGDVPNAAWMLGIAVMAVDSLMRESETVLVHCNGGRHRSPTVVASYLEKAEGGTFDEQWNALRKIRTQMVDESWVVRFLFGNP